MAITMTRAQFFRSLQEGIDAVFGMALKRYPEEWTKIYEQRNLTKQYAELVMRVGLGAAQSKAENAPVGYDAGGDAWNLIIEPNTWALAFSISEEAIEDNLYGDLGREYGEALATSFMHTREINAMIPFNNATDGTNYPLGDGVALLSTAHPLYYGGTFANTPTEAADLSESALEDSCVRISLFPDDRGIPTVIMPNKVITHASNHFVLAKILQTATTPFSADNTQNVVRGQFPGGMVLSHYMTDTDMWLVQTDAPQGALFYRRQPLKRGVEGDFSTGSTRYKGRERYKHAIFNPRAFDGSAGA